MQTGSSGYQAIRRSEFTSTNPDPGLLKVMRVHEQEITRIDEEIEVTMRHVRQLQFKKFKHQEKIKECQGLMTLARRMPPEILASIFEECVKDGWTRTPLTASHVCSEWRTAANIPTVWSHVYVNCDARDPCGRTRFWLEKAQNSLLRVTIDVGNDAFQLPGVMEILLENLPQWRVFTINATTLWQSNYILSLCTRSAPELCAVNISVGQEFDDQLNTESGSDFIGLVNAFPEAPRFLALQINRNILPSAGTLPPSITDLSITLPCHLIQTKLSTNKLLHMLRGLPQLQKFSLSLMRGQEREFEAPPDATPVVELSELTILTIIGSRDVFAFLPYLFTPKLKCLYLRSSLDPLGYPDDQITSYLTRFIQSASPRIQLFELHDIDLPVSDLTACLAGLPYLRELRLHESEISDLVIEKLYGAEGLCPFLDRIDLRWCGQVTGRALVELVKSRRHDHAHFHEHNLSRAASAIELITVINCAFVRDDDIIDLAQETACRIVTMSHDYCRFFGCCSNERYRRRLQLHRLEDIRQIDLHKLGRLILR